MERLSRKNNDKGIWRRRATADMTAFKSVFEEIQIYGICEVFWHIVFRISRNKTIKIRMLMRREKHYLSLSENEKTEVLKEYYKDATGEELDLKDPKNFNQKIQWLKLYDNTPLKTTLADKYCVREWVKEQIGEEYLIPLLGAWGSAQEIDFDSLPDKFVLKTNHGCRMNLIVKDKNTLDLRKVRRLM